MKRSFPFTEENICGDVHLANRMEYISIHWSTNASCHAKHAPVKDSAIFNVIAVWLNIFGCRQW